jgi:hypothetical protein
MIGLGLRWDYKSNNPNYKSIEIKNIIVPGSSAKYGYYEVSINGQPLGPINPRIKTLMSKATGIDATDYDGAIINLYTDKTFISAHNDVDEAADAIGYPVLVLNIGGSGNFSVQQTGKYEPTPLNSGDSYVFGINGENRKVMHRTFPSKQDGFLPAITTAIDGETYSEGSYRLSITLRRVKNLEPGMPTVPAKITTQSSTSVNKFDKKNIFTVTPIQTVDKKATIKASIATQYIGYGEGITGSSTETYRQQAGVFANTGNYSADDVIFVSIGGRRGTAEQQKTQQDRTIKEATKAIEAGSTILTDNKAYTDSNSYNTGEKRLYANMEANDYNYSEIIVDGQVIGTWSKSTQSSQQTSEVEILRADEIAEFKRDINNPELFITDGKIDKNKIMSSNNVKAKEIYNRYNAFITPLLEAQQIEQNNTVKSLVNQGQLNLFTTIDSALETFYNGLSTEESNNTNLPSIEYAQDFYTNAPHAYKNINEYIESLKCL